MKPPGNRVSRKMGSVIREAGGHTCREGGGREKVTAGTRQPSIRKSFSLEWISDVLYRQPALKRTCNDLTD
jgi:hypothetical protein